MPNLNDKPKTDISPKKSTHVAIRKKILPQRILNLAPQVVTFLPFVSPRHQVEIPSKIHLIWLGSILPIDYLVNIYDLIALKYLDNFEVNLWVDNDNNFYKAFRALQQLDHYSLDNSMVNGSGKNSFITNRSPSVFSLDALSQLIHIRNINEIIGLYEDLFRINPELNLKIDLNTIKKLLLIADKERIGIFCNYAAAADIYRYLILYALGGFYIDVDDKINFAKIKMDKRKLITDLHAKYGFLYHATNDYGINNDLLLSSKGHPLLEDLLKYINDQYTVREKQNLFEIVDVKRSKFPSISQPSFAWVEDRRTLTIKLTGPEALAICLTKYKEKYNLSRPDRNSLLIFDYAYLDKYICYKCDNNWLNNHNKSSRTDEDLYNKYRFLL